MLILESILEDALEMVVLPHNKLTLGGNPLPRTLIPTPVDGPIRFIKLGLKNNGLVT